VFRIRVPLLRDRPGDLPLLAEHLLAEAAERGVRAEGITAAALKALVRRRWPGNVRELRNVLERAATLAGGGPIEPEHVAGDEATVGGALPPGLLDVPLKEAKHLFALHYARYAVERHDGSVAAAARAAGVTRQTLYRAISDGEKLEREVAGEEEEPSEPGA